MKLLVQNSFIISIIISLLALFGCAKPIPPENLVPTQIGKKYLIYSGPLYQTISVDKVGGGKETNPMLMISDIGSPELEEAITKSLKMNNYLSSSKENSKYKLNVFLVEIDRPTGGLTITITTFVRYKLIDVKDNKIIFDKIINASGTKTVSDAFSGSKRFQIAHEESMKKNIGQLLEILFTKNKQL